VPVLAGAALDRPVIHAAEAALEVAAIIAGHRPRPRRRGRRGRRQTVAVWRRARRARGRRERRMLLAYLCARHPELVVKALDEHEAQAGPVHRPPTIA
jgi:hypothetical protein